MSRRFVVSAVIAFLMLALGWQLGMRYQQGVLAERLQQLESFYGDDANGGSGSGMVLTDPEREADLSLLWSVWRLLNRNYIEPDKLGSETLIMGATEGLVRSVGDPYTLFMTPKENKDFHEGLAGTLQGIGAELSDRDGYIMIVSPIKGSPAEKAGLLPNDVITHVNDEEMAGKTLGEVVGKIRGPKGTSVKLTVLREKAAKALAFTITRDEIQVPSVEARIIETGTGSVGYVALNQFGEHSVAEMQDELITFRDKGVKAIVLDLRFNGGGYLEGAVDITSFFVREGRVVTVEHRRNGAQHHSVSGNAIFPDVPLAVLQNEGSASASEIVAGALQDHHRAVIVGQKSFGKGTVQEVIDLPGGSSLRVTVAKWLTPNGKNLGKEGVHPDVLVERTQEDVEAKRDPQLDAALAAVFRPVPTPK